MLISWNKKKTFFIFLSKIVNLPQAISQSEFVINFFKETAKSPTSAKVVFDLNSPENQTNSSLSEFSKNKNESSPQNAKNNGNLR